MYTLAEIPGPGCEVKLIKREHYKQALLSGEGEVWDELRTTDLVIGGLQLECDFM